MDQENGYVDMINLSKKDQERFLTFTKNSSKYMDIQVAVSLWNNYAKCVEEYVFFRRKGETFQEKGKQ